MTIVIAVTPMSHPQNRKRVSSGKFFNRLA